MHVPIHKSQRPRIVTTCTCISIFSPFLASLPSSHLPDSRTQHQSISHCPASYDTNQSVVLAWGSSVPAGGSGRCSRLPHWVDTPRCGLSDSCANNTHTEFNFLSLSLSHLFFPPPPPSHYSPIILAKLEVSNQDLMIN